MTRFVVRSDSYGERVYVRTSGKGRGTKLGLVKDIEDARVFTSAVSAASCAGRARNLISRLFSVVPLVKEDRIPAMQATMSDPEVLRMFPLRRILEIIE
jgi:hypothetical protein